jgi:hypothetical protein
MQLLCITTMLNLIQQQWPPKHFKKWFDHLPNQHTNQILPHLTTILQTIQRCITWMPICKWCRGQGPCGFMNN